MLFLSLKVVFPFSPFRCSCSFSIPIRIIHWCYSSFLRKHFAWLLAFNSLSSRKLLFMNKCYVICITFLCLLYSTTHPFLDNLAFCTSLPWNQGQLIHLETVIRDFLVTGLRNEEFSMGNIEVTKLTMLSSKVDNLQCTSFLWQMSAVDSDVKALNVVLYFLFTRAEHT